MVDKCISTVIGDFDRINQSQDVRLEVMSLADISKKNTVKVKLNGGEYMQGFLFNLMDANVDYVVDPELENGITIFNWRIDYKEME